MPTALGTFCEVFQPRVQGPLLPGLPEMSAAAAGDLQPSPWPRRDVPPAAASVPEVPRVLSSVPLDAPEAVQPPLETPPLLSPGAAARSPQLEQMAQEADRHTRRGFELAGRNATFAAHDEFVAALKIVAQGLDSGERTSSHSQALASALAAMSEADDFLAGQSSEVVFELDPVVRRHRTPVLKGEPLEGVSPMSAMQRYFTFAQEQFTAACGSEVAGSMALHGMGKLYMALAQANARSLGAPEPKAIACFQAALLVFPDNAMAANELGVVLARCGKYEAARSAVEHSLSIRQESTTWHNLSVIYERLGMTDLSARAERLAEQTRQAEQAARRASNAPLRDEIQWMAPAAFGETYGQTESAQASLPARSGGTPPAENVPKQSSSSWFPWKLK